VPLVEWSLSIVVRFYVFPGRQIEILLRPEFEVTASVAEAFTLLRDTEDLDLELWIDSVAFDGKPRELV
jgi:hypothetical protein